MREVYEDKMRIKLTDVAVRQFPYAPKGQIKLRDDNLPGFGLIVGKASKSFFVMYGDHRTTKTIGRYPETTLKEARAHARKVLASPPRVSRSISFSEAREEYLADCTKRLRKSTTDRYFHALKPISARSLDSISANVADPTTLKILNAFYNWCIDNDYTDRNPFARKKVVFPIRHRLLTDDEVAAIFNYEHPPFSDIVKLLILTGQRRSQISKYDPDWCKENVVTFPAFIMKSNRSHMSFPPKTGPLHLLR